MGIFLFEAYQHPILPPRAIFSWDKPGLWSILCSEWPSVSRRRDLGAVPRADLSAPANITRTLLCTAQGVASWWTWQLAWNLLFSLNFNLALNVGFFCLVSKWIKSFIFLFCLVGIFCTVYICEDWLSYRLPFSCYLITAVTAGLVSIFDSWLHEKNIRYWGQDTGRTLTWFKSIWWFLSYLTWRKC